MAYDSRVFRILIASPSDVEEEREIAVRVIQAWNDLHSYTRKVTLLPLRWETHTAPEYGTRPQEVINRAIVDHCDLLIGVFWTRIGTPTGAADSGTLEEIDRVGKAGKPVMLYFSRVSADPDSMDTQQVEELRKFKKHTYPNGLVESYKSHIEFKEKLERQLELKVRELQARDASGESPIAIRFVSPQTGDVAGAVLEHTVEWPEIKDIEQVPTVKRSEVEKWMRTEIVRATCMPLAMVVENVSSSGVRNLYVELEIQSPETCVAVFDDLPSSASSIQLMSLMKVTWASSDREALGMVPSLAEQFDKKLGKFNTQQLLKTERGWVTSFECDALQPQRTRLVKPVLYVSAPRSTELTLKARIFTDTFPEPHVWEGRVTIDVKEREVSLSEIAPNWQKALR